MCAESIDKINPAVSTRRDSAAKVGIFKSLVTSRTQMSRLSVR